MTDTMLLGVLRMPMDDPDPLTLHQFVSRARQAADEIDRLQATVAGLRKSAALRVQFHAAELADVIAERDMWKDTLAQRGRELANVTAELEQARKAAP